MTHASILARFGRADEAVEVVRKNVESGRWRRNLFLHSTLFESLRKDPRIRAIAENAPL